jgi:competence protein ComGB
MRDGFVISMAKNWSLAEQGNFLKKMGELLERGYSYSEAVESIFHQMPIKKHRELHRGLDKLKAGEPLYKVLTDLKFQNDLIGYIYFADKHGGMLEAISEGSKLALNKNLTIVKLKKILYYPLFMFIMTNILLLFVQQTLLPQYLILFNSMGVEVNTFTKVVTSFGNILPQLLILFLVIILLLFIVYFIYFRKLPIIQQRRYLVKIPIAGSSLRLIQTQYFSLQLGYLLTGGLSVHEALQLFVSAPRNEFYRALSVVITERLKTGENLSHILAETNLFEPELPLIISHGQTNGRLDKELIFFSQNCLNKLEETMEKSLKQVQPVLYGVIAILVISMYLSIMIPMFKLMNGL